MPITELDADNILNGKDKLLRINNIIRRYNIPRSTFERWIADKETDNTKRFFPKCDMYLGKSPVWLESTVSKWFHNGGSKTYEHIIEFTGFKFSESYKKVTDDWANLLIEKKEPKLLMKEDTINE